MTGIRPMAASTEDRFRLMFAGHHPAIFAYAARRVGRSDAADVAAETFTVAWRRIRRVPDEPDTLPWLYGVARNVVANTRRSLRRRDRLDARLSADPSPVARSVEADDIVLEAVAGLDPRDREILTLAAWEGLGTREIASVLGCSPNAAAVRLHRARRRLTAVLEGGTP